MSLNLNLNVNISLTSNLYCTKNKEIRNGKLHDTLDLSLNTLT